LRRVSAATAALFALALAACSSQPAKSPESRKPAPAFTLKDSSGHTVRLSDYRGKVVLLNFWATWCGPCKMEIPWFIEFERQYKDRGFAVLGISMDEEGWEAVKPFLAGMNVNYRVLMGDETVAKAYGGVESLPTSFIIDREGRIAARHIGLVSKTAYEKDLKELL